MKQPGGTGAAEQVHFGCHLQHSAKPKLNSPTLDSAKHTTHTYVVKTHPIEVEIAIASTRKEVCGDCTGRVLRVYDGVYQRAWEVQLRKFEENGTV